MIQTHVSRVLLAHALLACIVAPISGRTPTARKARAIQQALSRHPGPRSPSCIAVRRLSDNKEIFSRNGARVLEMASNAKLFTTAAALWKLGPDYQFRTTVIINGNVENGTLAGDLVIVGSGDPSISGRFTGDPMHVPRRMAAALRQFGIKRITGDLVMDDRLFDRVHRAPGWPRRELLWWYTAPVSALSFNDNCLDIRVTGADRAGAPARLKITPLPYGRLINNCTTCASKRKSRVTFSRRADGAVVLSGSILKKTARTENITVSNPPLYLAAAVRAAIESSGIAILGRNRLVRDDERARPEAREIFAWTSPLTDAVAVANRRSQNFYAEQILKTLGAHETSIGTFQSGIQAVHEFTRSIGIPAGAVTLADGCGLSPANRASPAAVVALLAHMYRSQFRDIYFNSLAVNGHPETTLRRRLTDAPIKGRIHAKTGTITSRGISALSGYAVALDGQVYAFSVLTNDFPNGRLYRTRLMEHALCRAIVGLPEKKSPKPKTRRNKK